MAYLKNPYNNIKIILHITLGGLYMKLKKGINLGGFLSQCNHEVEHYKSYIKESDIKQIADFKFDHVRLPIDYEIFEYEDGTTRDDLISFVDDTVALCSKYNLNIILDLHKAPGYDFNDAGNAEKNNLFNNDTLKERFINIWKRIAKRYGTYPHVAFELLNEVVEQENAEKWNELIEMCTKAIRDINTETPIIYGGIQWNSAKTLKLLRKPDDKNIIFTFHFYEPFLFTHQKAHWVALMPKKDIFYPSTMEYFQEETKVLGYQGAGIADAENITMGPDYIEYMIKEAIDAANNAGVSLYCGEFGVIDQAPVPDTLQWFKDVDKVFRKYDIGWSIWSYKEMDFGIMDDHYAPIRDELLKTWTA